MSIPYLKDIFRWNMFKCVMTMLIMQHNNFIGKSEYNLRRTTLIFTKTKDPIVFFGIKRYTRYFYIIQRRGCLKYLS